MNFPDLAQRLISAKRERRTVGKLTEREPTLTPDQAYQIQNLLLDAALGSGERLSGYKMGLTSRAKQKDVGVNQSIRGFLLKSFELSLGMPLDLSTRIHPRVEPEIAVVMGRPLKGKEVTLQDVVGAAQGIFPAFEVIDSRFDGFSFSLPDVIADNCSGSGYAIGTEDFKPRLTDLPLLGVLVKKNGVLEHCGIPAAVLGHPLISVVELVHALAETGRGLEAGQVILTGGITASVTVKNGDVVEFVWPGTSLHVKAEGSCAAD